MHISFYGAAQTVTGTQHLVSVNGSRILLDCGLYQGKRAEAFERNRNLPFEPSEVSALVLSHAHIDHSGNIPTLTSNGFRGRIHCTAATRDLCSAMLRDSGHIQEQDAEYANKRRARQGLPPVEPLYTQQEAIESLNRFEGAAYNRPVPVAPGVTCTFLDAGHILGSAMVYLECKEGRRTHRLLFSGDLGRPARPILRDPTPALPADVLLVESTYGNRLHDSIETEDRLRQIVNQTARRGGKLVIPAFAVGRTQEIVYSLHQLMNDGHIPEIPVFVDSPLAVNVTSVFRSHSECYDWETRAFTRDDDHPDPFGFERLQYVHSVDESKSLNGLKGPAIIISASGMAEAGRIQHHLKNTIEDPRNTVLIVGWQAPHTLGRRIVERQPYVRIFGEEYALRAEVQVLNGFSAHADRDEILDWTRPIAGRVQHAFIIHGEPEPAEALAQGLQEQGYADVQVPALGETCEI